MIYENEKKTHNLHPSFENQTLIWGMNKHTISCGNSESMKHKLVVCGWMQNTIGHTKQRGENKIQFI